MSTIGPTPPGLSTTGIDPAGGQVSLDEARQQGLLRGDGGVAIAEAAPALPVDPGEMALGLAAWDDTGAARTLPRFEDFSGQLARMERAEAANAGVDGILSAL